MNFWRIFRSFSRGICEGISIGILEKFLKELPEEFMEKPDRLDFFF